MSQQKNLQECNRCKAEGFPSQMISFSKLGTDPSTGKAKWRLDDPDGKEHVHKTAVAATSNTHPQTAVQSPKLPEGPWKQVGTNQVWYMPVAQAPEPLKAKLLPQMQSLEPGKQANIDGMHYWVKAWDNGGAGLYVKPHTDKSKAVWRLKDMVVTDDFDTMKQLLGNGYRIEATNISVKDKGKILSGHLLIQRVRE